MLNSLASIVLVRMVGVKSTTFFFFALNMIYMIQETREILYSSTNELKNC